MAAYRAALDDQAARAAAEEPPEVEPRVAETPPAEPAVEEPGVEEPGVAAAPSGARRILAAVAAAVALLVIGAGVGWGLGVVTRESPTASPSVLERWNELPETARPFEDGTIRDPDSRFLGEVAGLRLVGTVGTGTEGIFANQTVVCLGVRYPDGSAGGACAIREHFERDGITLGTGGASGSSTFFWGPDGPPAMVPCFPQAWLESCPAG